MKRWAVILLCLSIGCNKPTMPNGASTSVKEVVDLAKKKMEAAVAEQFGDDAANGATIEANAADVKTFGPDKWEVHGTYSGNDKNGVHIDRKWTAAIDISFGGLQCKSVKME